MKKTILIIDDDNDVKIVIKKNLQADGYRVKSGAYPPKSNSACSG